MARKKRASKKKVAKKKAQPEKAKETSVQPVFESPTLPDRLVKRAKKLGFTDEQIGCYTDAEALEAACNHIKPQITQQPEPPKKRPIPPKPVERPKGKPAQAKLVTEITATRAKNVRRSDYDAMLLDSFLRRLRISKQTIEKITTVMDCVPNKKDKLVSSIVVDYLKKG